MTQYTAVGTAVEAERRVDGLQTHAQQQMVHASHMHEVAAYFRHQDQNTPQHLESHFLLQSLHVAGDEVVGFEHVTLPAEKHSDLDSLSQSCREVDDEVLRPTLLLRPQKATAMSRPERRSLAGC